MAGSHKRKAGKSKRAGRAPQQPVARNSPSDDGHRPAESKERLVTDVGPQDTGNTAEAKEQFRTVFENMADGIAVADIKTGRCFMANPAFCRMLGYTQEEAGQLSVRDIHPGESLPLVMGEFEKQAAREQTLAQDIPVKRKDGSLFYADINSFPITFSGKTCLMGLFRDVTKRRRAEEHLRESESHFRSVVGQSSEGIVLTDEKGKIIEWNAAQEEITARARNEALGRPLWKILYESVPQEDRSDRLRRQLKSGIAEACRTGQAPWFDRLHEQELVRADGTRRWLQILAYPIQTTRGFRIGVACRDVTKKRVIEEALRESEEKYRTLVEGAGESIATVDKNCVFLFMNRTAAARLGGKPEDYIGKTMWDIFPKALADRQAAGLRKVMETARGTSVVALVELHGQQRWYSTTVEPVRDAAGQITAALVVGRDIHDLRQAQQELEEYREKMSRAEQLASLGTLSATIAHELTQPLTVSRLSLQEALAELRTSHCSQAIMEALEESLEGISDATSRVERVRSFARQSSSEAPRNVRLHEVVERTMKLLEGKARESRISLAALDTDDLPEVLANEKDMEQMCFALIENAIQAADGRENRRFAVIGHVAGGHVTLRFEDDCGGIPEENIDKIFQPFFTTKPPGEGTGLGLCIVERAVTQVRGKIHLENRPGQGATFCITLPLQGA